jgi:serine/threonine-protein kinase
MGQVFISYRHVKPDEDLAVALDAVLRARGLPVFIDNRMPVGTEWVTEIERQLCASSVFIVLLSHESVRSAMLRQEVAVAHRLRQSRALRILPVRIAFQADLPYDLGAYLNSLQHTSWHPDAPFERVTEDIISAIDGPDIAGDEDEEPEPAPNGPPSPGESERDGAPFPTADLRLDTGAVPLHSPFYVRREADDDAERLVLMKGSTTIVTGPRQVGKSSLVARALKHAIRHGRSGVYLDFQLIDDRHFESLGTILWYIAGKISRTLRTPSKPAEVWNREDDSVGDKEGVTDFVKRAVLSGAAAPVVFAFDEVDRLFSRDYRDDFFATLRGWHNNRAFDDEWLNLNIVLAHATDPALWISDQNQSPFNVGEKLRLDDFNERRVEELNARHGHPLQAGEVASLMNLVGGNPYLIRHALYLIRSGKATLEELTRCGADDDGPFGDHLRSRLWSLRSNERLTRAVLSVMRHGACEDEGDFQGLLAAGLIRGAARNRTEMRCELYRRYFQSHL